MEQVVTIQAAIRAKLARRFAMKLRKARDTVCKRVYRRIMRQRLMNLL